jgi:riboflavin synthase
MFTGIIEAMGKLIAMEKEGSNVHFTFSSPISAELKVDQSVAHNGICLTVVACDQHQHRVTAIAETINRTNIGKWEIGALVNLERCMQLNARLDGHLVQGHVDTVAKCLSVENKDGSWEFHFEYEANPNHITVEKGSICINGISLTVVHSGQNTFSVAIIPYTYEHTNMQNVREGTIVNLEFDVIGKYVRKMMQG